MDNSGVARTVGKQGVKTPADGYGSAHDLNDSIPF